MFYDNGHFDPVKALAQSFDRVKTAADAITATLHLRFAEATKLINPREIDTFLEAYPEVFVQAAMAEARIDRAERSRVVSLPQFNSLR